MYIIYVSSSWESSIIKFYWARLRYWWGLPVWFSKLKRYFTKKIFYHKRFVFVKYLFYEKIRNHLRETATNSAKIHSLARKYEHLHINQIQLRFLHFNQQSIPLLGIHMRRWAFKREKYTFINANIKVINTILKVNRDNCHTLKWKHYSLTFFRGTQRQFSENICSEDDLKSRIFGTFVVKFLACLPLLGFSNIYKMVLLPIFNGFWP